MDSALARRLHIAFEGDAECLTSFLALELSRCQPGVKDHSFMVSPDRSLKLVGPLLSASRVFIKDLNLRGDKPESG